MKNKIINTYGYISEWDTLEVTNMNHAFSYTSWSYGFEFEDFKYEDIDIESVNINTKVIKYIDSEDNEYQYIWDTSGN